jgi:ADP-ribose pyrophosphatase YjhB (NUDIX family)
MNFCSACGSDRIELRIPPDDNRPRHVCLACDRIHYRNPTVVVGTLPVWEDRILLCRRAIEPRLGYWTLPAGFLENGETLEEGALRETEEEAGAAVTVDRLHTAFSLPLVNQIYLLYLAPMTEPGVNPGPESIEARLFAQEEIPWWDLAFRAVEFCLREYLAHPDTQRVHRGSYARKPGDPWILG